MSVCVVCQTPQGPFMRDLPRAGKLERVVLPGKPYCRDLYGCRKRRDEIDAKGHVR